MVIAPLLHVGHDSEFSPYINSFNPSDNPSNYIYHSYTLFTYVETEAQRGESRSYSYSVTESGLQPRLGQLQYLCF